MRYIKPITQKSLTVGVVAIMQAGISATVQAQPATVTIQAGQPGKAISPVLIGVFFEDLNYAADGGLYAELIQNRSFEYSPTEQPDWNPLSFWELQKRGGGDGSIGVADMRPIHENNPHYALLTVCDSKSGALIAKIVNGAGASSPLRVELAGLTAEELKATKTALTGPSPDAFNEDGQPPAVKPDSSETTLTPAFNYEAPANSLTVFRIKK